MNKVKEYARVFWILGFVVFIVGFLTGMLAIALIPTKPDSSTQQFMIFTLGFVVGMTTFALSYTTMKAGK